MCANVGLGIVNVYSVLTSVVLSVLLLNSLGVIMELIRLKATAFLLLLFASLVTLNGKK